MATQQNDPRTNHSRQDSVTQVTQVGNVKLFSHVTVTTGSGETYEIPPYDASQLRVVRAGGRPRGTPASRRQRRRVFKRDGGRCRGCGARLDSDGPWEADHIVPRRVGGPTTMENLQLLCTTCNRRKGGRIGLAGSDPTQARTLDRSAVWPDSRSAVEFDKGIEEGDEIGTSHE